jgi:hypothetical protein
MWEPRRLTIPVTGIALPFTNYELLDHINTGAKGYIIFIRKLNKAGEFSEDMRTTD